ncbi:dolichol kinase [Coemansia thaxteri]|nr:dolichol kinase [Coemansia thaxteri]
MSELSSRARCRRLYYEACIPALLLVLLACSHGTPSVALVESGGAMQPTSSTALSAVAVGLAGVSLALRLDWTTDDAPLQGAAEFRPGADGGEVWGSLLVPLAVLASSAGAAKPVSAASARSYAVAAAASLAMAAAFTARVVAARTHGRAQRAGVWALWLAATCAVGRAGGPALGASAWAATAAAAAVGGLQHWLTRRAVTALPRSFTLGEAAAAAQGVVAAGVDLALVIASPAAHAGSPPVARLCAEAAVVCLPLAAHAAARVARGRRGWGGAAALGGAYAACGLLALALVAAGAGARGSWAPALPAWQATRAPAAVAAYWAALLAGAAFCASRGWARGAAASRLALHARRKAWHFLAALLFVPAHLAAPQLLRVALAGALAAFAGAESMRVLGAGPLAPAITEFVRRFADHRDAGPAVTAHFALLLGCALPAWLGGRSAVAALAGVVALGVADSAASLAGLCFGRTRWPASRKTAEGSAAFAASLLLAVAALRALARDPAPLAGDVVLSLALAALEALTEQNDNAVVPLCMYALVHALPPLLAASPATRAVFAAGAAAAARLPEALEAARRRRAKAE